MGDILFQDFSRIRLFSLQLSKSHFTDFYWAAPFLQKKIQ